MMPIGPLMIEHRLIERMIDQLERRLAAVRSGGQAETPLLLDAVDFFRTYADRTHHGKEEDILFGALADRDLADEHQRLMDELVAEHDQARGLVDRLAAAAKDNDRDEILAVLAAITALYRPHIEKEDARFFVPVMEYFSTEEQMDMLEEFREFDARMIHEKYEQIVQNAEHLA